MDVMIIYINNLFTFIQILQPIRDNTLLSKIETKLPLRPWRLGRLLGFEEETEISANSSATSTNMVNINDGLQVISVICDKINSTKNFFNGNRAQVLW